MTTHRPPLETWEGVSASPEATADIGAAVGRLCAAGDVVALAGDLGAGKTHFVRGLATGMGLNGEDVSSPTFVLMQEYSAASAPFDLVHIDAYRLGSMEDLASIGWTWGGAELRRDVVTALEWADRLDEPPAGAWLAVHLDHVDASTRQVSMQASGSWTARMSDLVRSLDAGAAPAGAL